MAVKIRLKRMGKIRAPYYRIVVADSRTKRDGRVIEEIGKYHPKADPSFIEVDSDRAQHWLGVGAQPSEPVTAILKVTGDWQKFRGEPAPEPMKVAEPRRDKADLFNEALKDSHGDPAAEAVTGRRTSAKTPTAAAAPGSAAPDAPAHPAPAAAAPATSVTPGSPAEAPAPSEAPASVEAPTVTEQAPAETPTVAEGAPEAETSPVGDEAAADALAEDSPAQPADVPQPAPSDEARTDA